MDKTIFPAWERTFPQKKAHFEAWERQIAKMADPGTAFPPTLGEPPRRCSA